MKEILIRLEDELYEQCKNTKLTGENEGFDFHIIKSIANGTVLPKGHGRLIDEPTEEEIANTIGGKNDFADCIREAVKTVFANATPIIEADKENKE